MKTISDLDITKINENHLVNLCSGRILFRRVRGNALEFRYNTGTFVTEVFPKVRRADVFGVNSGNCCMTGVEATVLKESERVVDAELYKIKIVKTVKRILDLDKVCQEQGIEKQYLKLYETADGRSYEEEKELRQLYGIKLQGLRIYGVKYTSRRDPGGTCYIFFDTISNLSGHFRAHKPVEK